MSSTSSKPGNGAAKQRQIRTLVGVLEVDLATKNLQPQQRNTAFAQLKALILSQDDAESLSNRKDVQMLCRYGFDNNSLSTSRAALKCLANVLLLVSGTRQMFVDFGYATKAAERMKNDNREDELLTSRILFLSTYDAKLDFDDLFENHQLAESINESIARHSKAYSKTDNQNSYTQIETQALSESLKLLFNLSQFYPHQTPKLIPSLPPLLTILRLAPLPSPPLQPPLTFLINAFLNLDAPLSTSPQTPSPLFPPSNPTSTVDRLIHILDLSLRHYNDEDLETLAPPLLALLRKLHLYAPPEIATHMRAALLPSNAERAEPLGRSDSLASFLLRLSTSPVAPNVRESVSSLLFELSGSDPATFVRNVGYGFAAGYLMTHNIPVPSASTSTQDPSSSANNSNAEDLGEKVTTVNGQEINPITGQRRDAEPQDEGPEMTDEEKEREAEKLFVLFERLKATGVVDVVNPVTRAREEGRFEEVE